MTDATGTLQNSYSYGAWGELRASSATIANSYGYIGREFAEEGLSFYRARYLDPGLGRFVSEDASQVMNYQNGYRYVNSNPANSIDSYGLDTPLSPEEQKECLATIMEALALVSKWSKKQCCSKEYSQYGCNISELLDLHEHSVKLGEEDVCEETWHAYVSNPGYKPNDNSIYICPLACRWPLEPAARMAQLIAHELMHFCQYESDIWKDCEDQQISKEFAQESGANEAAYICRFGK